MKARPCLVGAARPIPEKQVVKARDKYPDSDLATNAQNIVGETDGLAASATCGLLPSCQATVVDHTAAPDDRHPTDGDHRLYTLPGCTNLHVDRPSIAAPIDGFLGCPRVDELFADSRGAAICASLPLQFGADVETIRKALCRDARGNASEPLGVALDRISAETAQ